LQIFRIFFQFPLLLISLNFLWPWLKMASLSRGVVLVLFLAVLLRSLLFMFGIHEWIYSRIEFSTPVSSWKRGFFNTRVLLQETRVPLK
jgi:hypothetical protein